jgi:hypothetical protein
MEGSFTEDFGSYVKSALELELLSPHTCFMRRIWKWGGGGLLYWGYREM